jgi:hypothetical protein
VTIQSEDFVRAINTLALSVDSFHERFEIPSVNPMEVEATLDALRQRLSLLDEENGEYARALNRGDIDDATKEAIDVAYIALGTIHRLGQRGLDACYEITQKNNAKTPSAYSKRSTTGKVLMD